MDATFEGYRRPDGRVGVRNYVAVIPTSVAAAAVATATADEVGAWARATPHQLGTSEPDAARRPTERRLDGIGQNPKVGAVALVELGQGEI